jgi:hypothetical protein
MGAELVEKIMDTFLTLFTETQLQNMMLLDGTGVRVVEKFLFILQFVVKENDASFRKFIDRALSHCLDVIYPLVADVSLDCTILIDLTFYVRKQIVTFYSLSKKLLFFDLLLCYLAFRISPNNQLYLDMIDCCIYLTLILLFTNQFFFPETRCGHKGTAVLRFV